MRSPLQPLRSTLIANIFIPSQLAILAIAAIVMAGGFARLMILLSKNF